MATQLRVLCVDDNEDAARTVGELLELAGCDVRVCHDGPAALAAADEFHPDVCVIDLRMPGMGGEELATKLRERADGVRCVALTGLWDVDSFHRTHNSGFDKHLVKPVDPATLVAAVQGREPVAAC